MIWFILWSLLLAGVIFAWSTRHREITRARWRYLTLTSRTYAGPPDEPPFVSVLIAGKDAG